MLLCRQAGTGSSFSPFTVAFCLFRIFPQLFHVIMGAFHRSPSFENEIDAVKDIRHTTLLYPQKWYSSQEKALFLRKGWSYNEGERAIERLMPELGTVCKRRRDIADRLVGMAAVYKRSRLSGNVGRQKEGA